MTDEWQRARPRTTYKEARCVLDAQREVVADVDAKAMYTVRIVVVVVGLIVAAVRIGGPGDFRGELLVSGLALLLISMSFGVLTYTESDLFLGPSRSHIRRLADHELDDRTWEQEPPLRMGDWIEANDADLHLNARLLLLAQMALLGGVALVVGAVAL